MGRSNDASGCSGSADTSGVTGSSNIGLSSGTLNIADPGAIAAGGGDANTPYSQSSGTATVFNVSNGAGQGHTLTFTWNGSVRSNSWEAAVRQGEQPNGTTGCDICGYPGAQSRTQATDGHFVTVAYLARGNRTGRRSRRPSGEATPTASARDSDMGRLEKADKHPDKYCRTYSIMFEPNCAARLLRDYGRTARPRNAREVPADNCGRRPNAPHAAGPEKRENTAVCATAEQSRHLAAVRR